MAHAGRRQASSVPDAIRTQLGSLVNDAEQRREDLGLGADRRIALRTSEGREGAGLEQDQGTEPAEAIDLTAKEGAVEASYHRERGGVRDDIAVARVGYLFHVVRVAKAEHGLGC